MEKERLLDRGPAPPATLTDYFKFLYAEIWLLTDVAGQDTYSKTTDLQEQISANEMVCVCVCSLDNWISSSWRPP